MENKKLSWWKLMWSNFYIQLFALAVVFLVGVLIERDTFYSPVGFWVAVAIPVGMMMVIGYKAFFQFWRDYRAGKSR